MVPIIKRNLVQLKCNSMLDRKFVLFFILIFFSPCNGFPTEIVSDEICRTSKCNQTASRILKYMDATKNPCDNFYEFACGGYVKNTKIPDDKDSVNMFIDIKDKVHEQLKRFVEEEISPNTSKVQRLVKTYYDICMNETALKKHGLKPLEEKLKKLGGWPVVEGSKWNESAFNWTNSMYMLRELGYPYNYFFHLGIETDAHNITNGVIKMNRF